ARSAGRAARARRCERFRRRSTRGRRQCRGRAVISLADRIGAAERALALGVSGVVVALRGLTLLVEHLPLPVGSLVRVETSDGQMANGKWGAREADLPFASSPGVPGEIVGFDAGRAIVMVMGSTEGIRPGDRVVGEQTSQAAPIGPGLLG